MPPDAKGAPRDPAPAGGHFGLLLLCFFLSGLAALIYQTAWTRQFAFVFGTSELAVASVLAAYMGGLALGAAVVGRIAPRIRRPILVYGVLELAIAIAALGVPLGVRAATALYLRIFGAQGAPADEGGLATAIFYLVCSFAILLLPTSLMGATLPLLARHAVRREEEIGSRIARLYAMNTAGAVAGTVLTGFLLLPSLGLVRTVWVAVAANALVFGAAAALARSAPPIAAQPASASDRAPSPGRWILPLILVSGAVSFTYEVFWTRLLGHVLGGSVYAFATMLATFLTGIALGSAFASGRLASSPARAATAFAWAQVGTAGLSLAAYFTIDWTPGWVEATGATGATRLLLDAGIAASVLLPGALCIGATFPLAVRVLARTETDAGPASARVYAWNTVGSITGAIGAGFFLIPAVGFAWSISIAVATNAALAGLAVWRGSPRSRSALVAATAVVLALVVLRPEPPWQLLRSGAIRSSARSGEVIHLGVGRGATVMLQRAPDGWQLSSNGLAEAVINEAGVRAGRYVMVRWLSHLPAWGRPEAKSILVVGFGGGLVVESVPPGIEKVHVVEIEPEILVANRKIADQRARDPLSDPRLEVIVNDARSALLLTEERYDAIVSQPSHPWTAAASHLYTREFFELAREHLAEDGVFVQWMGLRFIDADLLRTLVGTLREVFPYVRVYRPSTGGFLFTASASPFEPERVADAVIARDPEVPAELGIHGGADILAHLVLDDAAAERFAEGAVISTDDRNVLQMHSPRIIRSGKRFDPAPLLDRYEFLARPDLEWDRSYLIRRSLATGLLGRATRLAESARRPAERAVAEALLARRAGQTSRALAAFRRALAAEPGSAEAQMGLLGLMRLAGTPPAEMRRRIAEPIAESRLFFDAYASEDAGDWAALQALEPRLAGVAPMHPGHGEATRLRARWRLERGGAAEAKEALRLLDSMLATSGNLDDLVTRARAASRAGLGTGATSSLMELARKAKRAPAHRRTLREALVLLAALPDEQVSDSSRAALRRMLLAKLEGTRPDRAGG